MFPYVIYTPIQGSVRGLSYPGDFTCEAWNYYSLPMLRTGSFPLVLIFRNSLVLVKWSPTLLGEWHSALQLSVYNHFIIPKQSYMVWWVG